MQPDHLSHSICNLCTTRLQVKASMVSQENQSNPSNRGSFKCSHLLSLQPVLDSKINSLNPTVIIMRFWLKDSSFSNQRPQLARVSWVRE